MNELCIRCGKPTPYHPNTPITLRRYFVEGSGQLCEECFYELYPVPGAFDSDGYVRSCRRTRKMRILCPSEKTVPNPK